MQETVAQRVFPSRLGTLAGLSYHRDRSDRAEQRKMNFYAKEVEIIANPSRASLEPSVVPGPPTGETEIPHSDPEGEDHSSARDAKRALGEPEQDLSGEIPIPSADETLIPPEIPAVPSGSTSSSSTSSPICPGASSSSGVLSVHTVRVPRCRIPLVSRQAVV